MPEARQHVPLMNQSSMHNVCAHVPDMGMGLVTGFGWGRAGHTGGELIGLLSSLLLLVLATTSSTAAAAVAVPLLLMVFSDTPLADCDCVDFGVWSFSRDFSSSLLIGGGATVDSSSSYKHTPQALLSDSGLSVCLW